MKIKTSELIGPALDWAVAKCEEPVGGYKAWVQEDLDKGILHGCRYSTDWEWGGPIIERERITISALFAQINPPIPDFDKNEWGAYIPYGTTERGMGAGPTPLIAAMRAFVTKKFGDEIEIPEELK